MDYDRAQYEINAALMAKAGEIIRGDTQAHHDARGHVALAIHNGEDVLDALRRVGAVKDPVDT